MKGCLKMSLFKKKSIKELRKEVISLEKKKKKKDEYKELQRKKILLKHGKKIAFVNTLGRVTGKFAEKHLLTPNKTQVKGSKKKVKRRILRRKELPPINISDFI